MTRVGVRELRQNASRYLELVKAGETVEVTERGALVALLVSPPQEDARLAELIAQGTVLPASGPFVLPQRVPNRSGMKAEEIIRDLREEASH